MWFGAGFEIVFHDVEDAKKIKPEIEKFLTETQPNVWAGKTARRKSAIIVPETEDKQKNADGSWLAPPGREAVYSDLFEALYKYIEKLYPNSIVSAKADFQVYDSYSTLVLKEDKPQKSEPRRIDYDLIMELDETYDGDVDAIAEEAGLSVEEVKHILNIHR